jgi:hypothetical protein
MDAKLVCQTVGVALRGLFNPYCGSVGEGVM